MVEHQNGHLLSGRTETERTPDVRLIPRQIAIVCLEPNEHQLS